MTGFRGLVAEHYDDTRFIPPCVRIRLVSQAVTHASLFRPIMEVADVGCGTGRLLRAFQALPSSIKCIGYDVSEEMLRVIPRSIMSRGNLSIVQRDCSTPHSLLPSGFDLILVHWISNVTPRWAEILHNCVKSVRPGGSLLWFQEQGDLYSAVDGKIDPFVVNNSPFSFALWKLFYDELGSWGNERRLALRAGLTLGTNAQQDFFRNNGFEIRYLETDQLNWRRKVSIDWLGERILRERAFSNFWRIPDSIYYRAVERVKSWICRYPSDQRRPVTLCYSSAPVLATRIH